MNIFSLSTKKLWPLFLISCSFLFSSELIAKPALSEKSEIAVNESNTSEEKDLDLTTKKSPPYSIVFVHLGPTLPSFLKDSIAQARLFNRTAPIVLLGNEEAFLNPPFDLREKEVILISVESLTKSPIHKLFNQRSQINKLNYDGLWTKATERFFCLDDYIQQYEPGPLFHMENDVMLYVNLEELLPIFKENYPDKIAFTFENDARCVADFLFIPSKKPLEELINFLEIEAAKEKTTGWDFEGNEMDVIGQFNLKYHKIYLDFLPIVPSSYLTYYPLNCFEPKTDFKKAYSNHFDLFHSVFDAQCLGQYLGGTSYKYYGYAPGYIDPFCVFDPTHFTFSWEKDSDGRYIPYMTFKEEKWRINNLHIHSKKLDFFSSLNPSFSYMKGVLGLPPV